MPENDKIISKKLTNYTLMDWCRVACVVEDNNRLTFKWSDLNNFHKPSCFPSINRKRRLRFSSLKWKVISTGIVCAQYERRNKTHLMMMINRNFLPVHCTLWKPLFIIRFHLFIFVMLNERCNNTSTRVLDNFDNEANMLQWQYPPLIAAKVYGRNGKPNLVWRTY